MSSARFAKDSRNAECSGGGEGDAGQQQDEKNGDQKKVIARYTFGKRWHRFRVLTPRMFILRGSRAMNDLRFKYRSRGRQGAPCSVMAVVYGRLFQPKEWTSDYVDQVLEHGDKLFRTSAMKCRLKDEEYLKTNLVHKEIYVGFYKILIDIEDSGIRGNLFGTATGCSDLAEGLRQFLREDASGVITAQATSVAVWRQSGDTLSFLYYDPAACDDAGVHRSGGTACLIRFKCLDDLHDHLLKNLDRRYDSRYCIDKVTVLRVMEIGRDFFAACDLRGIAGRLVIQKRVMRSINPMDMDEHKVDCTKPVPKDDKRQVVTAKIRKEPLSISISNYSIDRRFATEPLVNRNDFYETGYSYDEMRVNVPSTFTELPGKIGILHGLTHEGSEMYKGKGAQNVANCIAAIAMKEVHPVRTWKTSKLDEILTLGDTLYATVKTEKPTIKTMTAADLDDARIQIEDRKLAVDVDLITVTGTISSKAPSVLNLKQALEEFFLMNKTGTIETSMMAVAVWTDDDCYYLFDPRSCDATGLRVIEKKAVRVGRGREAEVAKEKKVTGSCCVIRLPDTNALTALFIKNLDPTKKNDRFTIRQVRIADDLPGTRTWNEFQPGMAGKTWVLRGEISNMDPAFEEENLGVQGLAMPVTALINAGEIPPDKWTSETVDTAVREGNDYYNWCKPVEEEEEELERPLLIQDLKKNLYLKNRKVSIDIEEAVVIGDLSAPDDSELPNLEKGLHQFFEDKQYAIVEANKFSVAVWKVEEELKDKDQKKIFYYYFDPNPRDELGQSIAEAETEVACVVRSSDLAALVELIRKNAGSLESEYAIHNLKSVTFSEPMTDEEIEADKQIPVWPELNNYSQLNETSALLLGTIDQRDEVAFKWQTRDKQQAANSLVALAMTTLYDPHLWYRELVDDILKIGDKLTSDNLINLPEAEGEEEVPRNYLIPSEIGEDFVIGVNRMSVDLEEESIAGKMTEIATLMQQFFEDNAMGVFRQDDSMMPIWKKDEVVFMMDPRGRDAGGERVEEGGAAAVMWFTDVASLTSNLQKAVQADDFVIDSVTMENAYETRVAEAERVKRTTSEEHLWHNFPKLADGVWNIDGNVSMMDERFDEANRGKQSAAISAMAIVFSKAYQPKYWTSSVLNEIIVTGDKLHSKCVERLGAGSVPLVNEIISEFFLSNRRIVLTIKDCVQAGGFKGRPPKIQDLKSGINNFFKEHDAGVLTVRDRNIAIWMVNSVYYAVIPDWSEETEENAGVTTVPRVFRFKDVSFLEEYLLKYLGQEGDYQITAIDVLDWDKLPPWKLDPSPAIRPGNLPPLNAYKRLRGEARAILRGGYHDGDEIFPENVRSRQSAANCVVALGMSVVKNPVTWTKKTMDEILAIGSGVYRESRKIRFAKIRLKPRDIIRVFYLGVNVLTADVEPNTVTGLVAIAPVVVEEKKKRVPAKRARVERARKKVVVRERTPPPPPILLEEGLQKFFQDNRAGILMTNRSMIAIWKDLGVYFMYDSRAKNDQGLPDPCGTSCIMWFACMEPLYDVIVANIDPREKYGTFEISRVIIKTVKLSPLPCPAGFRPRFERPVCSKKGIPSTVDVEPLSEYHVIDEELSVLCGTLHMNHHVFALMNRGLQSTAIAAVAIVVGLLHVPSTWTSKLVDAILKHGDSLHVDSARAVRPGARNLSPCELLTVFIVGDCRATVHVHEHTAAGLLHACDLAEALATFFRTNCAGILHTPNLAVAVMQHYGKFYLFDPCARHYRGRAIHEGTACVIKCDSIARMAGIFVVNCNLKQPNVYTLNAVNVLDLHFFSDARMDVYQSRSGQCRD